MRGKRKTEETMRQGQAQGGEIKKLVRDGHKAGQRVFESNLMQ